MNPKIPAVISSRSNMARKIAYAAKRAVFSRKAPTHPVNPIRNVMAPFKQRIKIQCLHKTNYLIYFMRISILNNNNEKYI